MNLPSQVALSFVEVMTCDLILSCRSYINSVFFNFILTVVFFYLVTQTFESVMIKSSN